LVGGKDVEGVPVDDATFFAFIVALGLTEPDRELLASMGPAIREGQLNQLTGDVELRTDRKPLSVQGALEAAGAGQS
jgi:NAD(P)H dehydrogenase (quinone)